MKSDADCDSAGTPGIPLAGWPDVVTIKGEHAERFLQAQLSCDVSSCVQNIGMPFAWCTPSGRVRVSGWLIRGDSSFLLLVATNRGDEIVPALRKFVLRDKVVISFGEVHVTSAGLAGQTSHTRHFVLAGQPQRRLALVTEISGRGSADSYQLAGIRAGVCELPASLEGRFVPQMLNLDLVGGVSFTKGCYPGQEVVARTHNLGRVKRRLLRFSADSGPPAAGTPIYADTTQCGEVVVAAAAGAGCELLAVTRLDGPTHGGYYIGAAADSVLRPEKLPYTIAETEALTDNAI